VVAVDSAQTLVRHAVAEDPVSAYALADGAALPFPDGSFDLVVAYNALQVVADMPGTVSEAGRVLDRGGCMCTCVVHPVTDLGQFIDDADARFMLRPDYFDTQRVDDTVERDDHTMTFRGWTYSLEQYAMALERAGLRIDSLREPRPTAGVDTYARWRRVPLFLNLRAAKA
jgi:ubiquinone/menaquinone biosynthesis C-methylase UbiE